MDSSRSQAGVPSQPGVSPRLVVLLVDDVPDNLAVLGEMLRSTYRVRVANSAARALEIVGTPPKPDLILLDVMMPEMDGYECLRRLRKNPLTRDIPVIFVTALDSSEDERLGLELGAVDYVTKPVRSAILRARIKNHLDLKRARDWFRDQNALLERELDRFLDILAHHFQEPVRRQMIFAQLLQRSLPRPLEEDAEHSLTHVIEGATRLRVLLRDVLRYLAAHQAPPVNSPCSPARALETALGRLGEKIEATAGEVAVEGSPEAWPAVWMASNQLTEVFHALLDNALTYARPDRPARPRVKAQAENGGVVFSIIDNGVGIPAPYRQKAFGIFERLDADHGRTGTGIGLALVKRVVEAAKGRVWIEDGDDGGARVCFSVPTRAD